MVVVELFSTLNVDPNKGTVYLDFDGNEGDMWEENIEDLSLC